MKIRPGLPKTGNPGAHYRRKDRRALYESQGQRGGILSLIGNTADRKTRLPLPAA